MVSRIEVIPSEVRGYGNIIEAKSLSDFVPVESDLVYSENVYSLTAVSGVHISLTASSSSINVGSSVTLTATVMEDDTPVTGETVSFYDGETLLGSDSTDSSGVATYSTSALTVGAHSLSAVYGEKTSNLVNVTVNKITPTITLSVPASGTVGTSYNVTGTLSVDGSVKLYENSVLKDTLTVSSGSFSKSITQNSEGTYSYYAVFEGSSTYESATSSTGSITVSAVAPSYDGVSLTSDKSILSYADSESATLTAQLLDGSSSASVSGVTVEFFKGSTSLGTATTNSNGVATKSYASAGVGDVSLTASAGTFVSETYVLEDCIYYAPTVSITTSTYSTQVTPQLEYLSDFKVECDFKSTIPNNVRLWIVNGSLADTVSSVGFSNYLLGLGFTGGKKLNAYISTGSSETYGTQSSFTVSTNTDYHFELIKQGATGTAIYEDTTCWTGSLNTKSWSTFRIGLMNATGSSHTITLTNLKIKPL